MQMIFNSSVTIEKLAIKAKDTGQGDFDIEALVQVSMCLDQDKAVAVFGRGFASTVFLNDNDGRSKYSSILPSEALGMHVVSFAGLEAQAVAPAIVDVQPCGKDEVKVFVKIPYTLHDETYFKIIQFLRREITLKSQPSQLTLPGADDAEDEESNLIEMQPRTFEGLKSALQKSSIAP